jgi:hypothetical protein
MSFILLLLSEYVNIIRIRIIIAFAAIIYYVFDEHYACHHHYLLRIAILIARIIWIIIKF